MAATTLLGGAAAGLLGQNVQGAATAAQNETLNNTCATGHNCGTLASALKDTGRAAWNTALGVAQSIPNAVNGALPGYPDYVPFLSGAMLPYDDPDFGSLVSLVGAVGAASLVGGSGSGSTATTVSDTVQAAQQRQAAMLDANTGFNVSPTSWDNYPTIGRNGTYITDQQAITNLTGPLNAGGETVITSSQAAQLEQAMGLQPGSLANGFKVRQVSGITDMAPRSPMEGNQYFQGPGQHLPGGGPEMVIESISTIDSANVKTTTTVKVK